MIPTENLQELPLPDGGKIATDATCDSMIRVIRFDATGNEQATLQLDHPRAGFGGGGWVISPSGSLLIVHYYSGQSEEAFALINLVNGELRLVAHSDYHFGDYASYAFSPLEDYVLMALPLTCSEWWACWEDDGLEKSDDNVDVLPFATLLLCSTDSGHIRRIDVEIAPTVKEPVERADYDPDLAPRLSGNSELSVQLPWSRVTFDLAGQHARVRLSYPP